MATPHYISLFFTIICLSSVHRAYATASPNRRFLLPIITYDEKLAYKTYFRLGNPETRVDLALDLGTPHTWFACNAVGYKTQSSKTYRPISCGSPKCRAYTHTQKCSNNNQICGIHAINPWTHIQQRGSLIEDQISYIYNGNTTSRYGDYSDDLPISSFPFTCAPKALAKGFLEDIQGVLSLGPGPSSFPSHVSKTFKVPNKFALCLYPGGRGWENMMGDNGALILGGGPYYLDPYDPRDYSKSLVTTPLLVHSKGTSSQYYINVRSIKVDGTPARFNHSLLALDKHHGVGGTTLSLSHLHTTLHREVYKALIDVFVSKATAMKITKVAPIAPFGACFRANSISTNKLGQPNVPIIDFILDGKSPMLNNKDARWRVYGWNAMVPVSEKVTCLGFVDGGEKPTASIIIGGRQMEDNFVEFDLESSRLGINYDPARLGAPCAQFNLNVPR